MTGCDDGGVFVLDSDGRVLGKGVVDGVPSAVWSGRVAADNQPDGRPIVVLATDKGAVATVPLQR